MAITHNKLLVWVVVLLVAVGQGEAYVGVQWPLQIILQDINDYIFGVDATVVEGWSGALSGLYRVNPQPDVCQQCNGTMSANLTASLGKYSYSASSVATAMIVFSKSLSSDEYVSTLNGGTGLAPVACAYNVSAGPGGGDSYLCNILASTGALQAPGVFSSVSGTANASDAGVGASALAGHQLAVASPLTLTQLGSTGATFRTPSAIVVADAGVTVQDEDGLTGVSLSAFVLSDSRVLSSPSCSQRNASLVLGSLATQIVGGDAVTCYKLYGSDAILVTAWSSIGSWSSLTVTDCSAAISAGAVTAALVFPQNFDTTGDSPFAYTVFSKGGSVQCAYGIFQAVDPSFNNQNWAILALAYGLPPVDYSSCDPDAVYSWNGPSPAFEGGQLNYSMVACGMPGGSCALTGTVVYWNNDNQPLDGSLQLAPNTGDEALVSPGNPAATCLWLQVPPTPGVLGDGSQALANGLVARATPFMYSSAKGVNHQADINACVGSIQADIGSLTIFNALSSGTSAVAAGAGVNAFKAPRFLAERRGMYRIFPLLVSIIEIAFVNVGPITYAVALAHKGSSTQFASWFDVDRNGDADYNTIDVFVATNLIMTGRADFYALQWVVVVVAILMSSAFVTYRWHIVPASYAIGYAPQSLAPAPSSEFHLRVRPSTMPYSDALETKYSMGSLGSAGSQALPSPDSTPHGVQLTPRR